MTKYFKRGTREYYQVSPDRIIRIVNKEIMNEVTIVQLNDNSKMPKQYLAIFMSDTTEANEIQRDEFSVQFSIASKLLVLD
jgi:hypothetical protein